VRHDDQHQMRIVEHAVTFNTVIYVSNYLRLEVKLRSDNRIKGWLVLISCP